MRRRFDVAISSRSKNKKNGDVPQATVGHTREETWESCDGCPIRPDIAEKTGKPPCYTWKSTVDMGRAAIERAIKKHGPERYGIQAIDKRAKTARFVRLSMIGDPSRIRRRSLRALARKVAREGLQLVGYTHMWRDDGRDLSGMLMASCNSHDDLRDAVRAGWRAAVVMPRGTIGTIKVDDVTLVECPAIKHERMGRAFTCNDCAGMKGGALCNASAYSNKVAVYFADHSRPRRSLPVVQ